MLFYIKIETIVAVSHLQYAVIIMHTTFSTKSPSLQMHYLHVLARATRIGYVDTCCLSQ